MVSGALVEHDFGKQLLCAVFKFRDESAFYPYVPKGSGAVASIVGYSIMSCILFFDGACRGNPGPMAIGAVLIVTKIDSFIFSKIKNIDCRCIAVHNSNQRLFLN